MRSPEPGDFPAALWLLLILPTIPVALGAVRLVRDVAHLERREQITAWVAYPGAVIIACLLLAGLSTGGIGDGRLVHVGPQMSTLALPLIGIVVVSTALVIAVLVSPLIPWSRSTLGSVRARVEAAERSEHDDAEKQGEGGERGRHDAVAERSALLARFARRNAPVQAAASAAEEDPEGADDEIDAWALPAAEASADGAAEEVARDDASAMGEAEGNAAGAEESTAGAEEPPATGSARRKSWLSRRTDR